MTRLERDERPMSGFVRILIVVAASLVAIFALGVVAGMIGAAASEGGSPGATFYLTLAAIMTVAAGAIWLIFRNRAIANLPTSPRMRKSRSILFACGALGFVTGIAFTIFDGGDAMGWQSLFSSDAPLSPAATLVLLAALIAGFGLSIRWHMLLDEHERAAYDFGAVVSIYLYFLLSAGWWLLARGGFAPAPNGYVIFWVVMVTWLIGWVVRRYR
jgi:hypothetical protein